MVMVSMRQPPIFQSSSRNKTARWLRPKNVADVDYNEDQILNALKHCIKQKQDQIEFENPYGDGKSAIKIINSLKVIGLDQKILQKGITY